MSKYMIQTMATLGAYSQADLIPAGILLNTHCKAWEKVQVNAHAKAVKVKLQAAKAKAEALAAEALELEELDSGDTDDEDVLQPSLEVGDDDLEMDE